MALMPICGAPLWTQVAEVGEVPTKTSGKAQTAESRRDPDKGLVEPSRMIDFRIC